MRPVALQSNDPLNSGVFYMTPLLEMDNHKFPSPARQLLPLCSRVSSIRNRQLLSYSR